MGARKDASGCRADIPPVMGKEERDTIVYIPRCRQRWGERQSEGAASPLKAEDIEEFLKEFAWVKETELALQSLFDGKFEIPKAAKLLLAARRQSFKARRDLDVQLSDSAFKDAITTHGKKFLLVKQALGEKVTTRQVVSKYYLWKRTDEFKEWWKLQKTKKTRKSRKEAERLRQWTDESDLETETYLSYHSKLCELCATGGSLLCCDGCTRAYHISCAQPPITKVPDKDWYCTHCQEAFGGPQPKLVPSEENKYCLTCPPLPGVPRSLVDPMTGASSCEEESSDDELEDSGSSESIDESDNANVSDCPSTDDLGSNSGKTGNLTDNESDSNIRISSSSPAPVNVQAVDTPVVKQEAEAQPAISSSLGMGQTAESLGVRRTPETQLERPGSGRKRHRKMLAPRRIPRFDS